MSDAPAEPPAAPAATEDTLFSNTIILTYNNHEGSYDDILTDLTDYFWNFTGETVHTYKCLTDVASYNRTINKYRSYATVVDTPTYKKTYVSRTADLRGIKSNLMIIIGHGNGCDVDFPPCIQFYDVCQYGGKHWDTNILYADSQNMAQIGVSTPMKLVTGDSDLLMLLCCHGNEIVPLYLTDMTQDVHKTRLQVHSEGEPIHSPKKQKTQHTPETRQTQDVLYFNCDSQLILCTDILMLLMISMVDGEFDSHGFSPAQRFTPIILRIMQIVRLFDDNAEDFWRFLEAVGCVVMLENVKKMQQQSTDFPKNQYFRIGGHKYTLELCDKFKEELLAGLRALTLVTWTSDAGLDNNLTRSVTGKNKNPPDIQFHELATDGSDKHVDEFLREYHRTKKCRESPCTVSAAAPAEPLLALLAQLRALDVEKKRGFTTRSTNRQPFFT